jgi:hypothetical protein
MDPSESTDRELLLAILEKLDRIDKELDVLRNHPLAKLGKRATKP